MIASDLITYAFHYILIRTLYDGVLRNPLTIVLVLCLLLAIKWVRRSRKSP